MRKLLVSLAAVSTAFALSACSDSSDDQVNDDQEVVTTVDEMCDDEEEKEEEVAAPGACVVDNGDQDDLDQDSDTEPASE